MATPLILAYDSSLPEDVQNSSRDLAASFATMLGETVLIASLQPQTLDDLRAWTFLKTQGEGLEGVEPKAAVSSAPMSAAPFVYRDDGKPDWSAMWTGFCELALYGGPPHRGADNPVEVSTEDDGQPMTMNDMIMEIRRGIWETTGLYSEPAPPHWMAVTCKSRRMAAWMCAAIILENVDARVEDDRLLLPAGPGYTLKDEVKSIITVVAKTHHYWQAHLTGGEPA